MHNNNKDSAHQKKIIMNYKKREREKRDVIKIKVN